MSKTQAIMGIRQASVVSATSELWWLSGLIVRHALRLAQIAHIKDRDELLVANSGKPHSLARTP